MVAGYNRVIYRHVNKAFYESNTTVCSVNHGPSYKGKKLMKNLLKLKLGVQKQPLWQSKSPSFSLELIKEDNRQQIANVEEISNKWQRNLQIL
uniref:Uncharacterized protein n=1 Tax=Romanomermis culicivorax TaxID=13658 RepID=A0A915JVC0_ROMCU